MNSKEKIRIIRMWTHQFKVVDCIGDNQQYAKLSFRPKGMMRHLTMAYSHYNEVITEAYDMVNEYVWGIVDDQ